MEVLEKCINNNNYLLLLITPSPSLNIKPDTIHITKPGVRLMDSNPSVTQAFASYNTGVTGRGSVI